MRIGFIGAGRVGFTLGKYLKLNGCDISGYYSRSIEHAKEAATFTDTMYFKDANELIKESDAIMLTVSDGAITKVYESIKNLPSLKGKILCHTSGALSSKLISDADDQYFSYSIHPIYAVSDKYESYKHFSNAIITIEGSEERLEEVRGIFRNAGLKCLLTNADSKYKYHAASVYASNLVCGMFHAAVRLMAECGISEEDAVMALGPLFRDNAIGIYEKGVIAQLTGPLERGDADTIMGHLNALSESDKVLYKAASQEVMRVAEQKHPDQDYSAIAELLEIKNI